MERPEPFERVLDRIGERMCLDLALGLAAGAITALFFGVLLGAALGAAIVLPLWVINIWVLIWSKRVNAKWRKHNER